MADECKTRLNPLHPVSPDYAPDDHSDDRPETISSDTVPADDVVWLPVDQIKVGQRFRKDIGDLESLKRSIE